MIELTVSMAESKDTASENCFEKNRKKSTGFAVGREGLGGGFGFNNLSAFGKFVREQLGVSIR